MSWVGNVQAQNEPALVNVSTRGMAGSGDNVLIAGFIIDGTASHSVAIRVLGPSLVNYGLSGVMADPSFTLNSGGTDIATSDDWKTDAASAAALRAANLAPLSDREPGLVRTLGPGSYTVIVRGSGSSTGLVLLEAYDLDISNTAVASSRMINLSTRGQVGGGQNVMIMGFVVNGASARDILVTSIADSLSEYGVSGVLVDPKVEIFDSKNVKLAESDDWIDSPDFSTIARTGFCPRNPLESAVWLHLPPGAYTAVVSGVNGTQGVALPEVYDVRSLNNNRFSPVQVGDVKAKLSITSGAPAQVLDLTFIGADVAAVNGGANGTFVYSAVDDFHATMTITASGYTLTANLLFYRDGYAVYDGTLLTPGGTSQKAGGILAFQAQ